MANNNEANTLGTQRTIRDYLSSTLIDSTSEATGIGLKITIGGNDTQVYGVDLLWSGQEYLISYKTNTGDDALPTIRRLVDVLPITFVKTDVIANS